MQSALASRHAPSGPLAPRDYEDNLGLYRYLGRQLPDAEAAGRVRNTLSVVAG